MSQVIEHCIHTDEEHDHLHQSTKTLVCLFGGLCRINSISVIEQIHVSRTILTST